MRRIRILLLLAAGVTAGHFARDVWRWCRRPIIVIHTTRVWQGGPDARADIPLSRMPRVTVGNI